MTLRHAHWWLLPDITSLYLYSYIDMVNSSVDILKGSVGSSIFVPNPLWQTWPVGARKFCCSGKSWPHDADFLNISISRFLAINPLKLNELVVLCGALKINLLIFLLAFGRCCPLVSGCQQAMVWPRNSALLAQWGMTTVCIHGHDKAMAWSLPRTS